MGHGVRSLLEDDTRGEPDPSRPRPWPGDPCSCYLMRVEGKGRSGWWEDALQRYLLGWTVSCICSGSAAGSKTLIGYLHGDMVDGQPRHGCSADGGCRGLVVRELLDRVEVSDLKDGWRSTVARK